MKQTLGDNRVDSYTEKKAYAAKINAVRIFDHSAVEKLDLAPIDTDELYEKTAHHISVVLEEEKNWHLTFLSKWNECKDVQLDLTTRYYDTDTMLQQIKMRLLNPLTVGFVATSADEIKVIAIKVPLGVLVFYRVFSTRPHNSGYRIGCYLNHPDHQFQIKDLDSFVSFINEVKGNPMQNSKELDPSFLLPVDNTRMSMAFPQKEPDPRIIDKSLTIAFPEVAENEDALRNIKALFGEWKPSTVSPHILMTGDDNYQFTLVIDCFGNPIELGAFHFPSKQRFLQQCGDWVEYGTFFDITKGHSEVIDLMHKCLTI